MIVSSYRDNDPTDLHFFLAELYKPTESLGITILDMNSPEVNDWIRAHTEKSPMGWISNREMMRKKFNF